jgi:hypothetical protein
MENGLLNLSVFLNFDLFIYIDIYQLQLQLLIKISL